MADSKEASAHVEGAPSEGVPIRLAGWRLWTLTFGLCLSVFLPTFDTTIVSTSLVAIANDLGSFEQSSWVVSGYLVSYFSFLIIWAKLSDIFGRKFMLVLGTIVFVVFSGACAGAATMIQLIVFRALQGIGAAGLFSMVPVIVAEMVDPRSYATFNALIGTTMAVSYLAGPLLGGVIPDHTTWKWIFLINLPIGFTSLCLVLLTLPANFPTISPSRSFLFPDHSKSSLNNIDFSGFSLLLLACILLIVAIEEAGTSYTWSSTLVLTFLVLALILFSFFVMWQRFLFLWKSSIQAVIPWSFFENRVLMGLYLNSFFSGLLLVTVVIEIPQRLQSVNFTSAIDAGIRTLPFTLMVAVGSMVTRTMTVKGRTPPIYVLTAASALQILGIGLLYSVADSLDLPSQFYGFEVLAGLGVGLSLTTLTNVAAYVTERRFIAVAMGGIAQSRLLGGAIGVSVATNLLNDTIQSSLSNALPADTVQALFENVSSLSSLSLDNQALVQSSFLSGYQKQFAMMLGFAAAEVLALALMWEWPPRRLP